MYSREVHTRIFLRSMCCSYMKNYVRSGHNFAHVKTAQLLWQVQNFSLTGSSGLKLDEKEWLQIWIILQSNILVILSQSNTTQCLVEHMSLIKKIISVMCHINVIIRQLWSGYINKYYAIFAIWCMIHCIKRLVSGAMLWALWHHAIWHHARKHMPLAGLSMYEAKLSRGHMRQGFE